MSGRNVLTLLQGRDSSSKPHERGVFTKAGRESKNKNQPATTPPPSPALIGRTESPAAHETAMKSSEWPVSAEWALVWVTAVLAYFTLKLWGATKALVADAKKTATAQSTAMDGQRAVMAAQQTAMEAHVTALGGVVDAMKVSAGAAQEAAALARRMLVATHPPALKLHTVTIRESSEGAPIISFCVENIGRSSATITASRTQDAVLDRAESVAAEKEASHDAADLIGQSIPTNLLIRAEHRCLQIASLDLAGPAPALPGITAVGSTASPPMNRKTLYFGGFLGFVDETGEHGWLRFDRTCVPTARQFSDTDV
jgi:hypothetical protein